MRRRRKQRVTWLPSLGTLYNKNEGIFGTWNIQGSINFDSSADVSLLKLGPVVYDAPLRDDTFPTTDNDAQHQLVDFIGNEYSLKRIVGKAFFHWDIANAMDQGSGPEAAQVTLGFFVARADDQGASQGEDLPVGGSTGANQLLYDPDDRTTIREPWIWRRKWIIGNPSGALPTNQVTGAFQFPPTNATGYGGGVADGPTIDTKIGRRIVNDDRLFYAISVKPYPLDKDYTVIPDSTTAIRYALDLRVLGVLRKAHNRSAF